MINTTLLSKGEQTRHDILEAAYNLFLEQGFTATTMRQIAQRAHLTAGGIYNHFTGKEEIFDILILEKHPYRQIIPILLSTTGDTWEAFARNAAQILETELNQRPDFLKLMFIETIEFNGRHVPLLSQTIYPQLKPLLERFSQSDNRIRAIPPAIILRTFIGIFFTHYMFQYLASPSQIPGMPGETADLGHAIDIFLNGILKPTNTA